MYLYKCELTHFLINISRVEEKSAISEILGFKIVTTLRCRCGQETQRQSDTNIINLSYPDCNPPGTVNLSFSNNQHPPTPIKDEKNIEIRIHQ